VLQIDLLYRPRGGADRKLASAQVTPMVDPVDGGFPGNFEVTLVGAPAVTPRCGDALVLRVRYLQGSTPYSFFDPTLTTP